MKTQAKTAMESIDITDDLTVSVRGREVTWDPSRLTGDEVLTRVIRAQERIDRLAARHALLSEIAEKIRRLDRPSPIAIISSRA